VDNIKIDLGAVGYGDAEWIGLAQDRKRWKGLFEFGIELSGTIEC
jgi:hypothetical protein